MLKQARSTFFSVCIFVVLHFWSCCFSGFSEKANKANILKIVLCK